MKKIILYDPEISSLNLGDGIISEACKRNLKEVLNDSMSINISTHMPISNYYMKIIGKTDLAFVLGSNLLMPKMNGIFRQWDIKPWNIKRMKPVILMGVGWHQYSKRTNLYTQLLYKNLLSKEYMHSVRDEYTKNKLNEIGIKNVINTGCPTLWGLTPDVCQNIPKKKSKKVIFTLTDYNQSYKEDKEMIKILKNNYEEIYFWIQGIRDYEYLEKMKELEKIKIISPSIEEYDKILKNNEIDFVGTRLHGGIRALQNKRRTIIISVDNRANELNKNYNIPILPREKIDTLEKKINEEWETNICIPIENIEKWKKQFEK